MASARLLEVVLFEQKHAPVACHPAAAVILGALYEGRSIRHMTVH
jgi:hypothetical protein